MRLLHINYDLNSPETRKDYTFLIKAIHVLGEAERVQGSLWALRTNLTPVQVRNHLQVFIDPNDSLHVTEVTSYASYNIPPKSAILMENTWNVPAPAPVNTRLQLRNALNNPKIGLTSNLLRTTRLR
ncbi:hypothetical protein [Paenibacillus sp. PL91]|uniref:hypothetical protein n=1 Tax=Paenibacillus sp. PL91 TaxID=2729538 RepID=UPI00145F56BC|nr:hypothetical protein [Paenibacillus sp. PL91]MBC9199786.1 hypothetical protein [Paenibacillus sp. PL91]